MFGRATIRLGIGPHSSCFLFARKVLFLLLFLAENEKSTAVCMSALMLAEL